MLVIAFEWPNHQAMFAKPGELAIPVCGHVREVDKWHCDPGVMASEARQSLLSAGDPPPVRVTNPSGRSLFLLLGDHAGNHVPQGLDGLGLEPAELGRHIGLDIGVSELGQDLAHRLDAVFVEQRYSRLVVDCNRSPGFVDAIAAVSDGTAIAGNAELGLEEVGKRYCEIFEPYHQAIAQCLDSRAERGWDTILVSLHSFTPVLAGSARPWDVGVLHDAGETSFAKALLVDLKSATAYHLGDNEPYHLDATDFTVPHHAYSRSLAYIELEIRQDHLSTASGVTRLGVDLAASLSRCAARWGAF